MGPRKSQEIQMTFKQAKTLFALSILLGAMTVTAFAGVTVSSPENGATVHSPVTFVASATATGRASITRMAIYVDSESVYSINRASLDTSVSMSSGQHAVVVEAFDSRGNTYSSDLTLNVQAATLTLTTSSLANGTVGSAYSVALQASGGVTPYTWSLASGSLPSGLTLSASGTISGTPTASGTSSFSITVKDSETTPQTATSSLAITIAPAATLILSTSSLANGTVGSAYSVALQASGGVTPYTWSLASGSLPSGLTLSASGTISGTPTASGTSSFSITVKDSETTPQTATSSLAITIAPAATLILSTSSLANGTVGSAYSVALQAIGGVPPYTWSLASGSLPLGLTLSTSGTISGTPTASGTFSFSITVKDSETTPQAATSNLAITIAPTPLQLTTALLPNGIVGSAYSLTLQAIGGVPPYTWSLASGSLPSGLTLSTTGTISGTPTASGTSFFSVTVEDSNTTPEEATSTLALTISGGGYSGWNFTPTLYASPSGSGTTCSPSSPCSLTYAFNTAAPAAVLGGNSPVIQAAAGIYSQGSSYLPLSGSGTSSHPIVLTCVTTRACYITSSNPGPSGDVVAASGSYFTVDGFDITDSQTRASVYQLIYITGSNQTWSRNTVHDLQTNCRDNGGGGFQVASTSGSNIFDANLVYNINNNAGCKSSVVQYDGILDETTGAGDVIENNIVYNVYGGWGINHGNGSGSASVTIVNNLTFGNSNGGITVNQSTSGTVAVIANNISVDNIGSYGGCGIGPTFSSNVGAWVVTNNDIYGNPGGAVCTSSVDGNTGSITATTDISVDPTTGTTFVVWTALPVTTAVPQNYVEATDSPTINAGSNTYCPTHDFNGNTRPIGGTCDIGPYEQ